MWIRIRGHQVARARRSPPSEAKHPATRRQGARSAFRQALSRSRRLCGWVANSVSCFVHSVQRIWQVVTHPRRWVLWSLGPACITWMLATEALTSMWTAAASEADGWPTPRDWERFAVLAVCATAYVVGTRLPEERRRAADLQHGEHIDQTSVYLFTGALVLPASLTIVLLLVVRAQRFFVARKPPSRFAFTSAAIGLSCLGVHVVAASTALGQWLAHPLDDRVNIGFVVVAGAAAVCAYFIAQAIVIGVGRVLKKGHPVRTALIGRDDAGHLASPVLGTWADQRDIFRALGIAACATLAMLPLHGVLLLLVLTPVTIGDTRREQRQQQVAAERERYRLDSHTDLVITGLPNEASFQHAAPIAAHFDHAHGQPTQLAMLDLDRFKRINDTYGHAAGDEVLRAVAMLLRHSQPGDVNPGCLIRKGDLPARLHGEEFAVLLPNTTPAEAFEVMERIRRAVQELQVDVTRAAGGAECRVGVTVSIGLAPVAVESGQAEKEPLAAAEEAVNRALVDADRALYASKQTRNRVSAGAASVPTEQTLDTVADLPTDRIAT
jgi:diguanylate cyclase (GGDEF)-like protein